VVVHHKREFINDRAAKILTLRKKFDKLILVSIGNGSFGNENIEVKRLPNPTGILRLIKLNKLKKKLDRCLFYPSPVILYVKRAKKILSKAIFEDLRNDKNVSLLTCLPSHDIALVGLYLKQKYPKIHWIIDWQDLWSYDENYFGRIHKLYRKRILELEKRLFSTCDVNITTNLKAKKVLEQHYDVPSHRVVSINHHFNREDLGEKYFKENEENFNEDKRGNLIRIGFLGTLFKPPRVPGLEILNAMKHLKNTGINVELNVYGNIEGINQKKIEAMSNNTVYLHGSLGHVESLRKIARSDFFLLLLEDLPNCRAVMSIKLPHYLMLKRPIIAIVPELSAVADIIKETNSGYIIPTNTSWTNGLKKIFQDYLNGGFSLVRDEKAIEKYTWQNISKQWMKIFTEKAGEVP
jgi:glycosyltransferase involved in cell wall biosynthesis